MHRPTHPSRDPRCALEVKWDEIRAQLRFDGGAICVRPRTGGDGAELRLVADQLLELGERPGVQCAALRPCSPDPAADALEVFEGDAAAGGFGPAHKLLGNAMVDVGGEPALTAGPIAQPASRGAGARLLEASAQPPVAAMQTVEVASRGAVAVRVGVDVDHAEIDSEPAVRLIRIWRFELDGDVEHPAAIGERAQVGLAEAKRLLEQPLLTLAGDERDRLAAGNRPDRHLGAVHAHGQDPVVVRERGPRTETRDHPSVAAREQLHGSDQTHVRHNPKSGGRAGRHRRRFLPWLKPWVSAPTNTNASEGRY